MLFPVCLHHLPGRVLPCSGLLCLLAINTVIATTPDDLVLTGPKRRAALEQLQTSVGNCLVLTMDDQTGDVSFSRVQKANSRHSIHLNEQARRLKAIIEDHTVIVNLSASDSMITAKNRLSFGGSYLGNFFTGSRGYGPDDDHTLVPVVATKQQVNPETARRISEYFGKPGADVLHEATEAYEAARYAQKDNIADTAGILYYEYGHTHATPQSGTPFARYLDNEEKETEDISKIFFVDLDVKTKNKPLQTIRRLYKDNNLSQVHEDVFQAIVSRSMSH